MALKIHMLASFDQSTKRGETTCGEPLFRSRNQYGTEYQAIRRIGGIVAVEEIDFFPDKHACQKCVLIWMKQ